MNQGKLILLFIIGLFGCNHCTDDPKERYLTEEIPESIPIEFMADIYPDNMLVHKGVFSPDLEVYYFTLSDKNFENFDVYSIHKLNAKWSEPREAFFNSSHNEHGMSFSPDGQTIYFSSTRPVDAGEIPQTWHIWKSEKDGGSWNDPSFVDIPNLRKKLVSHPTITNSGTLYFHSSNLDFSEMDIYQSKEVNDQYLGASIVGIPESGKEGKCTPFVSPDEGYLIFASIGNQLDLMISYQSGNGHWSNARKLSGYINDTGQGNPYVTPDNKYLFFTTGTYGANDWKVKWVNFEDEIKYDSDR